MENKSSLRRFAIIFVLTAALVLSASCGAKNPYKEKSKTTVSDQAEVKVFMTVEVTGERAIKINMENKGEHTVMYGNPYILEYRYGGEWYQVPFKNGHAFTMEGRILGPAEEYAKPDPEGMKIDNTSSDEVRLEEVGKLSKGHYRMIKEFSVLDDEDGSVKKNFNIAAEFDL